MLIVVPFNWCVPPAKSSVPPAATLNSPVPPSVPVPMSLEVLISVKPSPRRCLANWPRIVDCTRKIVGLFHPRLALGISDEIPPDGDIERVRMIGELVMEMV